MKISTRVEYGLAALIDIDVHSTPNNPVNVLSISRRQNIPSKYLEQVMTPLRQARLIIGIKGAKGGYMLGKASSLITVEEILNGLDSSILSRYYEASVDGSSALKNVLNNNLWQNFENSMLEIAQNTTLEMLVTKYKESLSDENFMFFI